jgi:hypothetical protein
MENPSSALPSAFGHQGAYHLKKQATGSGWATAGGIILLLVAIIFALGGVFVVSIIFLGLALWIFVAKVWVCFC